MLKQILINSLKSINELDFTCKKLNIIAGTNSSGKSTFIQSILMAKQNEKQNIGLNGPLVNLGDFKDAKNFNSSSKEIGVVFKYSTNNNYELRITEDEISKNDFATRFKTETVDLFDFIEECNSINYLSCDRIGAEDIYKKNYSDPMNVGINGEFAIYSLEKNKDKPLSKEMIVDNSSYTLSTQVNYWLNYILGASITTEDVVGTDFVKCFYVTPSGKMVRPKNIGAGFSYLVSIIVMCLLSNSDDIIIIENPEIHLHPQAQSKVCEFLYFIAKNNRQLFIETHSDHIFNGVRVGIATEKMQAEDVSVNFFSIDDNNCTQNTVIEFGKRGRIMNYTEGLFDQFDIDLNRMLNI